MGGSQGDLRGPDAGLPPGLIRLAEDAANGDEVALFDGTLWYFDTNHDFIVDTTVASPLRGLPIVGDFDGDGTDDLATWQNDTFYFDLANNGFGQQDAVLGTAFWAVAFTSIYVRPVSHATASRWIYANIPIGTRLGIEDWDEGLPLGIDGRISYGAGGYFGLDSTQGGAMSMAWEDVPEKRDSLYRWLNEAEYLIISSNRRWASAPRMPSPARPATSARSVTGPAGHSRARP